MVKTQTGALTLNCQSTHRILENNLTRLVACLCFIESKMEFKAPKPKKRAPSQKRNILPLKNDKLLVGVFNGQSVTITDFDSMNRVYDEGCFGKGSLSKSRPNYHNKKDDIPKVIYEQQFENLSKWTHDISNTSNDKLVGCVRRQLELSYESVNSFLQSTFCDSGQELWKSWKRDNEKVFEKSSTSNKQDSVNNVWLAENETDDYGNDSHLNKLVNDILYSKQAIKPTVSIPNSRDVIVVNINSDYTNTDVPLSGLNARLENLPFFIEETLNLNLEESFFLNYVMGCLKIVDLNNSELSASELWLKFRACRKNFIERYVIYHYYRSKGWIVRSGLKYGGDYLLYKVGPECFHASYLVQVTDKEKKMSWKNFIAMNRLVETFNKDLILCEVIPVRSLSDEELLSPDCLRNYQIQEVFPKRWFSSRERISKEDSSKS